MTTPAAGPQSLSLQGSPGRARFWLVALAFGFPAIAILVAFGIAFAHGAPAWPVVLTAAFALGITGIATLWILRMLRRIAIGIDGATLVVDTGIASRRFAFSSLRAGGFRIVDFADHTELKPILRTWGIGMPGLASGWFRLRNGAKALCVLTGRDRVCALHADDGTWILLSLADSARLRDALERSWARHPGESRDPF